MFRTAACGDGKSRRQFNIPSKNLIDWFLAGRECCPSEQKDEAPSKLPAPNAVDPGTKVCLSQPMTVGRVSGKRFNLLFIK